MNTLLVQLRKRRKSLGLKQSDMLLRVGVSRQQYQHLESKGNPRLNTLELITKGLKSELMLIPYEKLDAVKVLLSDDGGYAAKEKKDTTTLADDPWKDILGDGE